MDDQYSNNLNLNEHASNDGPFANKFLGTPDEALLSGGGVLEQRVPDIYRALLSYVRLLGLLFVLLPRHIQYEVLGSGNRQEG